MSKFEIDYSKLGAKIYKTAYRLNEVKDQLEVVAFDLVRFKENDRGADLWQIQSADDGDYIVALYQPEESEKVVEAKWEVMFNKTARTLQFSYHGDPLLTVGVAKLGIPVSEGSKAEEYLPKKLAENKKLVQSLLNQLPESTKQEVLKKYPDMLA